MSRGTVLSRVEKVARAIEKEIPKKKRNSFHKKGPKKGKRILSKNAAIKATRFTVHPNALSGIFSGGGFLHRGSSYLIGGGKGRKGGRRGAELDEDCHFIQYVGDSSDLARLEESILQEYGRVRPLGRGPDR